MSGGGSGGHVFPAIAIADAIKKIAPDAEFLFIGAKGKMEMEAVPKAGYQIIGLNIAGFQRKLSFKNLMFPFKLVQSILKAWFVLKKFKPNAAIGTGGYASGAALKVAQWQGVPSFVQEQNAFPGVTNKLLAKDVRMVFAAYPGLEKYFSKATVVLTGNPLRASISLEGVNAKEAKLHFNLNPDKKVVFITGGSLGASAINKAIAHNIGLFQQKDIQLIWQCGKIYEEEYGKFNSPNIKVLSFIDRMDLAYAAADIIVSRAGGTISELAIIGKPVIFIPSPNVAEDHQTKNAQSIVDKKGAIMLKESELDAQFSLVFEALLKDKGKQEQLSANIKRLALPNATKQIVDEIVKLIQ